MQAYKAELDEAGGTRADALVMENCGTVLDQTTVSKLKADVDCKMIAMKKATSHEDPHKKGPRKKKGAASTGGVASRSNVAEEVEEEDEEDEDIEIVQISRSDAQGDDDVEIIAYQAEEEYDEDDEDQGSVAADDAGTGVGDTSDDPTWANGGDINEDQAEETMEDVEEDDNPLRIKWNAINIPQMPSG